MKKDDENKRKKPADRRKKAQRKTIKAQPAAKKAAPKAQSVKKSSRKPATKAKPAAKKSTPKRTTRKTVARSVPKAQPAKRTPSRKKQPIDGEPNYPEDFLKELEEAEKRNAGNSRSIPVPRHRASLNKRTIEIPKGAKVRDIRVHYKFD